MWRNDKNKLALSNYTIDTLAILAEDIHYEDEYKIIIYHCNTRKGKGFKPSIYYPGGSVQGGFILGTDKISYDKALEEANNMITKQNKIREITYYQIEEQRKLEILYKDNKTKFMEELSKLYDECSKKREYLRKSL